MSDGIPSPNPDFPQPIKNVTGNANIKIQNKNLLPFNLTWQYGYVNGTGDWSGDYTHKNAFSDYIYLKAGTYTISYEIATIIIAIAKYNTSKVFIERDQTIYAPNTSKNKTFTLNQDGYIRISHYDDTGSQILDNINTEENQIEIGSTATSYVPHQEQNLPFSLKSKNLINYKTVEATSNTTVQLIDNGFKVTGKYAGKVTITGLKPNTNYYLQYNRENITGNIQQVSIFGGTGTSQTIKNLTNPDIFNTGVNTTINIWFYTSIGGSDGESNFTNIQLEEGSTATSYEPYYDIRAMQGTELLDDGIHNTWKKVIFDGTENWRWNDTKGGAYCDSFRNIIYSQAKSYANAVCNYFILNKNQTWVNNHFGFNDTGTTIWFLNTSKFSSLTEWTSWLAQQYANGTPVTVEYELETEEIIPYNTTQQAQYNAIKQAHTYKDVTYISSESDELPPELEIQYWKERGTEE